MDQIALPYRIALAAVLAIGVLWFVALRPKDDSGSAAPAPAPAASAPGVKGLSNDVAKAKGAVAESQQSAAAATAQDGTASTPAASTPAPPASAPATAPAPAAGAAAKPADKVAAAPGDPSKPILAELAKGRVAVVLFSERKGVDDAHVRAVLHRLDRHHGKVVVRSAPISQVGDYEAITRGVKIMQAPTLLVIGPKRTARAIVGYTDLGEVDQLVGDALRAAA